MIDERFTETEIENNGPLEDKANEASRFLRADKVIGNTITGIAMGLGSAINPEAPFYLYYVTLSGYNVITPPNSNSLPRHLAEIVTYTTYAFAVKYLTQEMIEGVQSVAEKLL